MYMHQEKIYETRYISMGMSQGPVSYFFSWCIYMYVLKKIVYFYPLHRIDKNLRLLGFPGGSDG